jgi:hypothetical protein
MSQYRITVIQEAIEITEFILLIDAESEEQAYELAFKEFEMGLDNGKCVSSEIYAEYITEIQKVC